MPVGTMRDLGRSAQCPGRILSIASRMVLEHRRCSGAGISVKGEVKPAMWRRKPAERSRSEEHTSELQSLMRDSYAVFCLKKKFARTRRPGRRSGREERRWRHAQ